MLTGTALARRVGDKLAAFTPQAPDPGFTMLFDGTSLAGWRMSTITNQPGHDNPGQFILVNGSPRATTFTSPTQLSATILAGDIAAGGALSRTTSTLFFASALGRFLQPVPPPAAGKSPTGPFAPTDVAFAFGGGNALGCAARRVSGRHDRTH
jgi:hypothetical protein